MPHQRHTDMPSIELKRDCLLSNEDDRYPHAVYYPEFRHWVAKILAIVMYKGDHNILGLQP